MQQTITKPSAHEVYRQRRVRQPALMKRAQLLFVAALVMVDVACTWLAYFLAYTLLVRDPDVVVGPFLEFWPLPLLNTALLVAIFFAQRMYQRRRPVSHLDELFKIITYNTFAVLLTIALLNLGLRDFDPHRRFVIFAWAINIGLLTVLRGIHAQIQWAAQARGIGDDRVLIIGAGEVGQMLLQKIRQNRKLGYQVAGIVDNGRAINTQYFSETPVLGVIADIPWIIERY
nr:hypothetical protein [Caldilineaceae bacterium]